MLSMGMWKLKELKEWIRAPLTSARVYGSGSSIPPFVDRRGRLESSGEMACFGAL